MAPWRPHPGSPVLAHMVHLSPAWALLKSMAWHWWGPLLGCAWSHVRWVSGLGRRVQWLCCLSPSTLASCGVLIVGPAGSCLTWSLSLTSVRQRGPNFRAALGSFLLRRLGSSHLFPPLLSTSPVKHLHPFLLPGSYALALPYTSHCCCLQSTSLCSVTDSVQCLFYAAGLM